MKRISLVSVILFAMSVSAFSQIGVSSYSVYSLGVNTSKEKKISGELKSFFNRGDIEYTQFELAGMYNFNAKEYHQFSVGLGLNVAPFVGFDHVQSFVFPIAQLEIFPFQNFKQLSLVIEIAPEWIVEDNLNIRHLWGFRYTFKRN